MEGNWLSLAAKPMEEIIPTFSDAAKKNNNNEDPWLSLRPPVSAATAEARDSDFKDSKFDDQPRDVGPFGPLRWPLLSMKDTGNMSARTVQDDGAKAYQQKKDKVNEQAYFHYDLTHDPFNYGDNQKDAGGYFVQENNADSFKFSMFPLLENGPFGKYCPLRPVDGLSSWLNGTHTSEFNVPDTFPQPSYLQHAMVNNENAFVDSMLIENIQNSCQLLIHSKSANSGNLRQSDIINIEGIIHDLSHLLRTAGVSSSGRQASLHVQTVSGMEGYKPISQDPITLMKDRVVQKASNTSESHLQKNPESYMQALLKEFEDLIEYETKERERTRIQYLQLCREFKAVHKDMEAELEILRQSQECKGQNLAARNHQSQRLMNDKCSESISKNLCSESELMKEHDKLYTYKKVIAEGNWEVQEKHKEGEINHIMFPKSSCDKRDSNNGYNNLSFQRNGVSEGLQENEISERLKILLNRRGGSEEKPWFTESSMRDICPEPVSTYGSYNRVDEPDNEGDMKYSEYSSQISSEASDSLTTAQDSLEEYVDKENSETQQDDILWRFHILQKFSQNLHADSPTGNQFQNHESKNTTNLPEHDLLVFTNTQDPMDCKGLLVGDVAYPNTDEAEMRLSVLQIRDSSTVGKENKNDNTKSAVLQFTAECQGIMNSAGSESHFKQEATKTEEYDFSWEFVKKEDAV